MSASSDWRQQKILSLPDDRPVDAIAFGGALLDVLEITSDEKLQQLGLTKGRMTLVDRKQAQNIYAAMGDTLATSGGSTANTAAALARLGSRAAFVGKVADDRFGEIFAHDLRAAGVAFNTTPLASTNDHNTGRVLILVTPDGERTMCAELGASQQFSVADVETAGIEDAKLIYLESYLLDGEHNREAYLRAIEIAWQSGTAIAISLSDPGCVERHPEQLDMATRNADLLFANRDEYQILKKIQSDQEPYRRRSRNTGSLSAFDRIHVITDGANGITIKTPATPGMAAVEESIPAESIPALVDTTGAGDMFAAGFLYGVLTGRNLHEAGRMGAIVAAEVLGHLGARPASDLQALLASKCP